MVPWLAAVLSNQVAIDVQGRLSDGVVNASKVLEMAFPLSTDSGLFAWLHRG